MSNNARLSGVLSAATGISDDLDQTLLSIQESMSVVSSITASNELKDAVAGVDKGIAQVKRLRQRLGIFRRRLVTSELERLNTGVTSEMIEAARSTVFSTFEQDSQMATLWFARNYSITYFGILAYPAIRKAVAEALTSCYRQYAPDYQYPGFWDELIRGDGLLPEFLDNKEG